MQATLSITGAAFDELPYDGEKRQELLEGECVEIPSTTPEHQDIVANLSESLRPHLRTSGFGNVYADVEFALGENTRLRPDLAVVLGDTWRNLDRQKIPIPNPPAIAIEVISPSERTSYSTRKVRIYLTRGVQEVWQVFPEDRTILVYSQSTTLANYADQDNLTSPLLPGWGISVSQAFTE
jgi:Uma2 family endonuclease